MEIVAAVLVLLVLALAGAIVVALRQRGPGLSAGRGRAMDPFAIGEPWRRLVSAAQRAQTRYHQTVAGARPGPTHERLRDIGRRVDLSVEECWAIARRGDELRRTLSAMNIGATRAQLERLGPDATDERARALRSRVETYDRVAAATSATEERLRLLVARLEETAARGAELAVHTTADAALEQFGTEIEGLAIELEALRQALDETGSGRPELGRPDA